VSVRGFENCNRVARDRRLTRTNGVKEMDDEYEEEEEEEEEEEVEV